MNRRKRKRRTGKPYRNNNIKNKFLSFVLVVCVSVAAGYLTANYILGPVLGLEPRPSFFEFTGDDKNEKKQENDKKTETETIIEDKAGSTTETGFALQYGSFSSEQGAGECVDDLKKSGINAEIVEKDGMYKVVGDLFETKEEARSHLEESNQQDGVFITEIP